MTSIRAEGVAEVLWELKRADKVATLTAIAERAGFSAGSNGRTVKTALKTVRRDWGHLHWWRAIDDTGEITADSEHTDRLVEFGYEVVEVDGKTTLVGLEEHLMEWEQQPADAAE